MPATRPDSGTEDKQSGTPSSQVRAHHVQTALPRRLGLLPIAKCPEAEANTYAWVRHALRTELEDLLEELECRHVFPLRVKDPGLAHESDQVGGGARQDTVKRGESIIYASLSELKDTYEYWGESYAR